MALYVLGDTHLSEAVNKPMDIFGGVWKDSRQKLIDGLGGTLKEGDTLVLAGDFSWGMTLDEALLDFRFLDQFPGRKILLKGNHDYWWQTLGKMYEFLAKNGLFHIDFLHNNCYLYKGIAICGTRGWYFEKNAGQEEGDKVFKRELIRLEKSLSDAKTLYPDAERYCFLHYPPIGPDGEVEPFTRLMRSYGVTRCFYGHLHGISLKTAYSGMSNGIDYRVISADHISFRPVMIAE